MNALTIAAVTAAAVSLLINFATWRMNKRTRRMHEENERIRATLTKRKDAA